MAIGGGKEQVRDLSLLSSSAFQIEKNVSFYKSVGNFNIWGEREMLICNLKVVKLVLMIIHTSEVNVFAIKSLHSLMRLHSNKNLCFASC